LLPNPPLCTTTSSQRTAPSSETKTKEKSVRCRSKPSRLRKRRLQNRPSLPPPPPGDGPHAIPMARSILAPTIAGCWSRAPPTRGSPSSTPFPASSGWARVWPPAASFPKLRWTAPSPRSPSAPRN